MRAAFYAGRTGLIAHQDAMDVIGNNLANVNTNGYLNQGVSFNTLLHKEMYANTDSKPLTGFGVKSVSTGVQVGQGALRSTGNQLDFAIAGNGFFAVENREDIQYTRDGAFVIAVEDGDEYLGTADGAYVLDVDGDRIEIPMLEAPEEKDSEKKSSDNEDSKQIDYIKLKEQIGLFTFPNPTALSPVSGNKYKPTEKSGEAEEVVAEDIEGVPPAKILQGYIENSSTSIADEMANMIAAQRAFQISAKVVQTADENERIINELRR